LASIHPRRDRRDHRIPPDQLHRPPARRPATDGHRHDGNRRNKAAADTFAICIQGGAILAVLGLYYKRVLQMIRGVLGQDPDGLKLAVSILVGFMPAAVIGLILNDWIEEKLFGMWPVIFAWVVGGILILATAWWAKRSPKKGGGARILLE
jgi:undecaprenyl-diphosphatase